MEEARLQAAELVLQGVFWITLVLTIFWCVMWSIHRDAVDNPAPEETDQDRRDSRQMIPLYLRYAVLTGLVCVFDLLMWKLP